MITMSPQDLAAIIKDIAPQAKNIDPVKMTECCEGMSAALAAAPAQEKQR